MRLGVTVQDVFEWLYEVDHVRLSYGLKYNGVELEKLSPGTKGIVLLILYLGMDVADSRPLIVDQPDENLDNESIYKLLTAYFKTAKKRRQIILITHNPNLVVNADSEQVIVATAERRENGFPHITYQSGALEDNVPEDRGIRQQVCRILEGGADAFRKPSAVMRCRDGRLDHGSPSKATVGWAVPVASFQQRSIRWVYCDQSSGSTIKTVIAAAISPERPSSKRVTFTMPPAWGSRRAARVETPSKDPASCGGIRP